MIYNIKDTEVKDTGWIEANLSNGFTNYAAEQTLMYRRIGNIVYITGALKPPSNNNLASANYMVASYLPEGFRPIQTESFLKQGSGTNIFLCEVATDGAVRIGRYRNSANYPSTAKITVESWLTCACSFATTDSFPTDY